MASRRNRTRLAVLGALSLGPTSGAELREDLRRTLAHFWHESEGQLYPALHQLVEDGEATVHTEPSRGEGGRPRQVYTVTADGLAAFDAWLQQPPSAPPPPRNELLLKLFFGARAPTAVNAAHLYAHREELQHRLATYEQMRVELAAAELRQMPDLPYWLATLEYGLAVTRAALDWCDQTLDTIAKLPPSSSTPTDGPATPGEDPVL